MNLSIELLRASNVLGTLQGDGWKVETESETRIFANHPEVPDEIAARKRLNDLDLLTSGSIRIDFQTFRRKIRPVC
jgi:hypothetical protein